LVVGNSCSVRAVDRDLVVVSTESVSVGIRIREKSALEHLINRWLNTWDDVSWGESRLLNLSKIVFRVLVQNELANWDERVILLRNGLGYIENVIFVIFSLFLRNKLDIPSP
jgi:hypothetical protein